MRGLTYKRVYTVRIFSTFQDFVDQDLEAMDGDDDGDDCDGQKMTITVTTELTTSHVIR